MNTKTNRVLTLIGSALLLIVSVLLGLFAIVNAVSFVTGPIFVNHAPTMAFMTFSTFLAAFIAFYQADQMFDDYADDRERAHGHSR